MNFEYLVQKSVYEALNGNISVPVYDIAPEKTPYPYVTIGEDLSVENGTDTTTNDLVSFTINTWSRSDSSKEIKLLMGEIKQILHLMRFTEPDVLFTANYFKTSQVFYDTDGITRHGVQEFNLTIEEL